MADSKGKIGMATDATTDSNLQARLKDEVAAGRLLDTTTPIDKYRVLVDPKTKQVLYVRNVNGEWQPAGPKVAGPGSWWDAQLPALTPEVPRQETASPGETRVASPGETRVVPGPYPWPNPNTHTRPWEDQSLLSNDLYYLPGRSTTWDDVQEGAERFAAGQQRVFTPTGRKVETQRAYPRSSGGMGMMLDADGNIVYGPGYQPEPPEMLKRAPEKKMQPTKNDGFGMAPLDRATDERNAASVEAMMAIFRGMPKTPYKPDQYAVFAQAANQALTALGGGQLDFRVAEPTGPVEAFPPDAAKAVSALKMAFDQTAEGQPYRFSLDSLETPDGLMSVSDRLMAASKDRALASKLMSPGPVAFSDDHSTMTNLKKPKPEKKTVSPDALAFAGDATNDNRKTAPFAGDATNDNRKTRT